MALPDHYATLEVAPDADTAALRRAFRRKVRELHPDVSAQKEQAHEAFLKVQEAYAVLRDPQRRSRYDQQRANERAREEPQSQRWESTAPPPKPTFEDLMQRGQAEFLAGHYQIAYRTAVEALSLSAEHPDAILLIVRIYNATGRDAEALQILEVAVQAHPTHLDLRRALNDSRRNQAETAPPPPVRKGWKDRIQARRQGLLRLGVTASLILAVVGILRPGEPLETVVMMPNLSAGLVGWLMASCAALGWGLASSGSLPPIDDELFYPDARLRPSSRLYGRSSAPIGLTIPLLALLNYYVAAIVAIAVMAGRGVLSHALIKAFAIPWGFTLLVAITHAANLGEAVMWAPGVLLFGLFAGWFFGEFFR